MRRAATVAKWLVISFCFNCGVMPGMALAKQHRVASGESIVIEGQFESSEGFLPSEIPSYIITGDTAVKIFMTPAPKPPFAIRIYLNEKMLLNFKDITQVTDGNLNPVYILQSAMLKPGKNTVSVNVIDSNGSIGRGKARVMIQHEKKLK